MRRALVFLILLTSSSSYGMGEIERFAGWWANAAGFGTVLAHVEAERGRIQADYEIKKAEFRAHLEADTLEQLRQTLRADLEANAQTIEKLKALEETYENQERAREQVAEQLRILLRTRRTEQERLEILLETIRQEVEESSVSTKSFHELEEKCRQWQQASAKVLPTCATVELLSAQSDLSSRDATATYFAAAHELDRMQVSSDKSRTKLKAMIQEAEILRQAIEAKLKKLEER